MVALVFAVLAAMANATGSVLQRLAARTVPEQERLRLRLIGLLMRRRVWLTGIAVLVSGGIFQAIALYHGGLALVQPIAVAELPLALLLSGRVFHGALGPRSWLGILAMSAGLVLFLVALAPSNSHTAARSGLWLAVGAIAGAGTALLVAGAARARGNARSALLAAAAGLGFGLTAALMKSATQDFADGGIGGVLTGWSVYAMGAVGFGAFFLYQHAVHAGPLVASQPPVTIVDPVVAVVLGVVLFGESARAGLWLLPAGLGLCLIAGGAVALSRSPLLGAETARSG